MALDNPMESCALLIQVAKLLLQRLGPLEVSESFLGIRSELLLAKQTVARTISSLSEEGATAEPHPRFLHQLKDLLCDLEDVVDTICGLANIHLLDQASAANSLLKHALSTLFHLSQLPKRLSLSFQVSHICRRVNETLNNNSNYYYNYNHSRRVLLIKNEDDQSILNNFANLPLTDDDVYGRDVDKALLINMLLTDSIDDQVFSFVSVVGMGGVGKTTLASLVYNDQGISSMFDLRLWVSVSARFHLSTLVASMLRESIGGKKYLLVLDDVWTDNPDDWVELRRLLRGAGGARGSKVLLTTRSNMVPKTIGYGSVFQLKCLSDEDSWNVFKKVVFGEGDEIFDDTLVQFGRDIVKKCLNLPLAITVMAQFLKGQGRDKWLLYSKVELANIRQVKDGVINVLKLSYDHLPSPLKTLFAYCCLFPKQLLIQKKKLIHLWMAQGWINHVDGESLEDIGEGYFNALLERNFFDFIQVNKVGEVVNCRVHGFLHDVAKLVAGEGCVVAGFGATEFSRQMRHLSIYTSTDTDLGIKGCLINFKRVRSFISFAYPTKQGARFERMVVSNARWLRSLGLSSSEQKTLPREIGKILPHLRYLDLSYNFSLEKLPCSITELVNLQTLDLSGCWRLKALPSSIHKLANLRHLDITDCDSLTHMPSRIGSLTCLRTMTMFVVGNSTYGSCYKQMEKLESLTNLRGTLLIKVAASGATKKSSQVQKQYLRNLALEELCIKWHNQTSNDGDEYLLESLEPHPNLQRFTLEDYGGVEFNSLSSCVNLVKLFISDCPRLQHLPRFSHLCHLKELALHCLWDLEYLGGSASTFFPSLESLRLCSLPKLKAIREEKHTEAEANAHQKLVFPCLVTLCISWCPSLASLPLCPNIQEFHLTSDNQVLQLNIINNPFSI